MVAKRANSGSKKIVDMAGNMSIASRLESCLGCKWTLHVLGQVRKGVCRPGAIVRAVPGLTTKVLNERLTKLVRFDIIERRSYPEIPPRVEYHLTAFGKRFVKILDAIDRLERESLAERSK